MCHNIECVQVRHWRNVYKAMQKQGESMPGSSSKEEFVGSNDNPFNEHSQHVPKEGPQR
jgi:hypothetical protein